MDEINLPKGLKLEDLNEIYEQAKDHSEEEAEKQYRRRNVDIAWEGKAITLPNEPAPMPIGMAISTLERKAKEGDKTVAIEETFDALPLDGAHAFHKAASYMFGWTQPETIRTFFRDFHPTWVTVQVDYNRKEQVLWGRVTIPNTTLDLVMQDRGYRFHLVGECRQRHRELMLKLTAVTEEILKTNSIYRGKSWTLPVAANGVCELNKITFMEPTVSPGDVILSKNTEELVSTNLFTPILYTEQCRRNKIPLNRGVLLHGKFGVGKTLLGTVLSGIARANKWTFVHLKDVRALAQAMEYLKLYEPAVLYAEDIDRTTSGARTVGIDKVLNTLDGVNTKGRELMVVLTTNEVETINPAMIRPGRLDAIIEIEPPDDDAAERLLRLYGRNLLDKSTNLHEAKKELAGQIPAVIREVMERAKLAGIWRTQGKDPKLSITDNDLVVTARSMQRHRELMGRTMPTANKHEALGLAFERLINGKVDHDEPPSVSLTAEQEDRLVDRLS